MSTIREDFAEIRQYLTKWAEYDLNGCGLGTLGDDVVDDLKAAIAIIDRLSPPAWLNNADPGFATIRQDLKTA